MAEKRYRWDPTLQQAVELEEGEAVAGDPGVVGPAVAGPPTRTLVITPDLSPEERIQLQLKRILEEVERFQKLAEELGRPVTLYIPGGGTYEYYPLSKELEEDDYIDSDQRGRWVSSSERC